LIGDPSFKVKERDVLSFEAVQMNVAEIRKDIERVLESSGDENLIFVNNYDWYKDMSMIQFLRDVGK
jgi:tyrosine--tRNA ligase